MKTTKTQKQPLELLYAEWAIQHYRIIDKAMRALEGNLNMLEIQDAMNVAMRKLADKNENYELALKVIQMEHANE